MAAMRGIKAGVVYALAAFLVGFALGALRVLLVAPRVGATMAARALMGAVAFVVLMIVEAGIGALLFDQSLVQYCAAFGTAAGAIGLATQIAFAALPVVQGIRART